MLHLFNTENRSKHDSLRLSQKVRVAPEILQEILEDALIYRASDIHLEPKEDGTLIRFRVDGL